MDTTHLQRDDVLRGAFGKYLYGRNAQRHLFHVDGINIELI